MHRFATRLFGQETLYEQGQFAALASAMSCLFLAVVSFNYWEWGGWAVAFVVPGIYWVVMMFVVRLHQINRQFMSSLELVNGRVDFERRWTSEVAENAEVEYQVFGILHTLADGNARLSEFSTEQDVVFPIKAGDQVLVAHGTRDDVGGVALKVVKLA
ncbi:MAG: hypothetical protein IH867_08605 [Chloroflexi bacterium]|nr:hypothetical protein [Chloroflexota bacterium]